MSDLAKWLLQLLKDLLATVIDIAKDVFIAIVKMALDVLAAVLSAIPVPEFAKTGLSQIIGSIDPAVWYYASHLRLGQCFAVLGAAFAFRMARKLLTLFQW